MMRSDGPAQGTPGEARTIIPLHDPTIGRGHQGRPTVRPFRSVRGPGHEWSQWVLGGRHETGLAAIEGPVGKRWAGYTGTPGI